MNPQELIRKKRGGGKFLPDEIKAFVSGVADSSWADYQSAALLMAMFINGLDINEQNALTQAMLDSGERLDFSDIEAPKADKHSTGGVGDKTSLIIAPLAAACGVAVPMISGRGLGHTGGTLDKLEAIKGYNVNLSLAEFRRVIKTCGFSLIGQTAEIVPADKKLYALRDATATIESIPLIVASIMSKKLAEGLDALVLDVKTGSGAFMQEYDRSVRLAEALCQTGNDCGVKTEAVISDMSQPLGKFVGNALEVYECIKILRGEADNSMLLTQELSLELTARILLSCGIAGSHQNAEAKIQDALNSGLALEKFRHNIQLQGGNPAVCEDPEILLDKSLLQIPIKASFTGFITEIDASLVGKSISFIGGGRAKIEDVIDYSVGFQCERKIGDEIRRGDLLGILFCRSEAQAASIGENLQNAYSIGEEKPRDQSLIKKIIS